MTRVQVYLQNIKMETCGDTDINRQLDRLLELSSFYAEHWHELAIVPAASIVPGMMSASWSSSSLDTSHKEVSPVRAPGL